MYTLLTRTNFYLKIHQRLGQHLCFGLVLSLHYGQIQTYTRPIKFHLSIPYSLFDRSGGLRWNTCLGNVINSFGVDAILNFFVIGVGFHHWTSTLHCLLTILFLFIFVSVPPFSQPIDDLIQEHGYQIASDSEHFYSKILKLKL